MITHPIALSAVIAAVAALGLFLESRYGWGRKVSASLMIIFFGAVLSNLGLVPASSEVYGAIGGPVTSLAIVWLLFAMDLRDLKLAGPRMLLAFGLAVVGTAVGAFFAGLVWKGALGEETWKLVAMMTGTYSGGSLNFVSVGREVQLSDSLFAAATVSDNVLTAVWMGLTLMIPMWLRGYFPSRPEAEDEQSDDSDEATALLGSEVATSPAELLSLLALGFGLILAANATSEAVGGPSVVWLTTFALAIGQIPLVRKIRGALPLGILALNLFFVLIGIGSRLSEILAEGLAVFLFTATVVLVHGLVLFASARLLGLDAETAAVASQASVGGPSTAMALASARGYRSLVLPGTLAGLLGYAVGTYAGLAMGALFKLL